MIWETFGVNQHINFLIRKRALFERTLRPWANLSPMILWRRFWTRIFGTRFQSLHREFSRIETHHTAQNSLFCNANKCLLSTVYSVFNDPINARNGPRWTYVKGGPQLWFIKKPRFLSFESQKLWAIWELGLLFRWLSWDISATTHTILFFDGVLEPPDLWLSFMGSESWIG